MTRLPAGIDPSAALLIGDNLATGWVAMRRAGAVVNGVWTGLITVLDIAPVAELQAVVNGYPLVRSNAFAVNGSNTNTVPSSADFEIPLASAATSA